MSVAQGENFTIGFWFQPIDDYPFNTGCFRPLGNFVFLSFDIAFGLSMPWDCLLLEAAWIAVLLVLAEFSFFLWRLAFEPPIAGYSWLFGWFAYLGRFGP